MRCKTFIRLTASIFVGVAAASPGWALNLRDNQRDAGMQAGAPQAREQAVEPLHTGRPAATPGDAAVQAAQTARAENGPPLTRAEATEIRNAVRTASANLPGGNRAITTEAAQQLGALFGAQPPLSNTEKAQAVNAATWGCQFVKNDQGNVGKGFTLERGNGGINIVMSAGSSTNNMRIDVPRQGGGMVSSGVVGREQGGLKSTEGHTVSFTMTQSQIGAGSGQYTAQTHFQDVTAGQTGAFNKVDNISGHTNNGAAVAGGDAPAIPGGQASVAFGINNANGGANAQPTLTGNWTSNPASGGNSSTARRDPDASALPAGGGAPTRRDSPSATEGTLPREARGAVYGPGLSSNAVKPVAGSSTLAQVTTSGANLLNHEKVSGPLTAVLSPIITPPQSGQTPSPAYNARVANQIAQNPGAPVTVVFHPGGNGEMPQVASIQVGSNRPVTITPGLTPSNASVGSPTASVGGASASARVGTPAQAVTAISGDSEGSRPTAMTLVKPVRNSPGTFSITATPGMMQSFHGSTANEFQALITPPSAGAPNPKYNAALATAIQGHEGDVRIRFNPGNAQGQQITSIKVGAQTFQLNAGETHTVSAGARPAAREAEPVARPNGGAVRNNNATAAIPAPALALTGMTAANAVGIVVPGNARGTAKFDGALSQLPANSPLGGQLRFIATARNPAAAPNGNTSSDKFRDNLRAAMAPGSTTKVQVEINAQGAISTIRIIPNANNAPAAARRNSDNVYTPPQTLQNQLQRDFR